MTKQKIRIAVCMPRQMYTREDKLEWLETAINKTDCDLFCAPQEFLGGHRIMPADLHMDRDWVHETIGSIARRCGKHIALGACCFAAHEGATEDYLYYDDNGVFLGLHKKFALPSYDDNRTGGHGQLWPETNYQRRATPIDLPKLRLRIGTVFCWEVFSQVLWGLYSMARCNLIVHPIKFAPRGWLQNKKNPNDGKLHIVGFGNAPKSQVWLERLLMASKHQVMCPIAISCNSWDLGNDFMALVGVADEFAGKSDMKDVPSGFGNEYIHTFEMLPEYYEGLDHHHSAGAFKEHVGSVNGFSEMGEYTMHGKIRRIEAQLIGGGAAMDCALKTQVASRQKKSVPSRAFGKPQQVRLPKRSPS